jgi:alkylhydroperoxidase family enzyme
VEREPRVPRLNRDGVIEPVREVFDTFIRERGKVPNLFRVAAHRPEIVATLRTHMHAVMGPGTVDVLLKELVAVRVSQINNCEY